MYGRQRKVEKDVWISIGDFVDTCKLGLHYWTRFS